MKRKPKHIIRSFSSIEPEDLVSVQVAPAKTAEGVVALHIQATWGIKDTSGAPLRGSDGNPMTITTSPDVVDETTIRNLIPAFKRAEAEQLLAGVGGVINDGDAPSVDEDDLDIVIEE